MGKNPKPLTIYVHPHYTGHSWVEELRAKGHDVLTGDSGSSTSFGVWGADLILGPTCCRFLPGMEKFLDAIIKGARKVKYPAKVKP